MKENITVKFVEDLKAGCGAYGICLYWINEIHIDKSFKYSKVLADLIKHEKYHYQLITKILKTKSIMNKIFLGLWNNVWDILDVSRIFFKHPREFKLEAIVHLIVYVVIIYVIGDILIKTWT